MDSTTIFVIFLVVIALGFDFINGFHDSANSISTVVSTRVLKPVHAVILAAFFNFAAIFFIGVPVAKTMGTGIIDIQIVDNILIFSTLSGAIIWNLITWYFGIPSSSSHALIGALIGSALIKAGTNVIVWKGVIKVALFIILSPTIGLIIGYLLMALVLNTVKDSNYGKSQSVFHKMGLFSFAVYSIGHGSNDAQKTMGIIALMLYKNNFINSFHIPIWVEFACYLVIAMGTMTGGWRIVKTMGTKITKLQPIGGFCAQMAAAITILGNTFLGIPVSTTHTITGAIVGVGATKRLSAVRWGIAGSIIWAWILTIPVTALISALIYMIAVPVLK